jgi:hypothetical protein
MARLRAFALDGGHVGRARRPGESRDHFHGPSALHCLTGGGVSLAAAASGASTNGLTAAMVRARLPV